MFAEHKLILVLESDFVKGGQNYVKSRMTGKCEIPLVLYFCL